MIAECALQQVVGDDPDAWHAGSRLRRDLMSDGSVAPLGDSSRSLGSATMQQSGLTEKFAFARAVSRLYELTSPEFQTAARC